MATDTERLDWVITHEVEFYILNKTKLPTIRWVDKHQIYGINDGKTYREAIDKAMTEEKEK